MNGIENLGQLVEQPLVPQQGVHNIRKAADMLADFGRNGDTYLIHAAEGETVLPMEVLESNPRLKKMLFKQHFKYFYFPIVLVFLLIFKSNGSTALIVLFSSFIILFLSEFSFKNLIKFYLSNIILIFLGIFLLANFSQNSRVVTWKNRINNHISGENNYQVNIAQKAISSGKWNALGPGKSIQKHVLPQASSDFIYAIIIEEYSIVGGFFILLLYVIFMLRIIKYALKIKLMFPYLLLIGLGVLIVFQAFLNISVSLGIMPVTGQTLPLISKGGSSILITCFAIGIILNITSQFQNNLNYEED